MALVHGIVAARVIPGMPMVYQTTQTCIVAYSVCQISIKYKVSFFLLGMCCLLEKQTNKKNRKEENLVTCAMDKIKKKTGGRANNNLDFALQCC